MISQPDLLRVMNWSELSTQETDARKTCSCRKVFKNEHGLNIHCGQNGMWISIFETTHKSTWRDAGGPRLRYTPQCQEPHTSPLGEMQEDQDPDTHHSVRSLLDSELKEDSQSESMNQSMQE